MLPYPVLELTAFSVVASALVAGVFMAFSEFVMRSLLQTERSGALHTMQVINREVFRTLFMVLLIGMAALSPVLVWLAWRHADGMASALVMAGAAVYFIGVFALTLVGNVPLNIQLDRLDNDKPGATAFWTDIFYPRWVAWNHIRTVFAATASICFLLACIWRPIA